MLMLPYSLRSPLSVQELTGCTLQTMWVTGWQLFAECCMLAVSFTCNKAHHLALFLDSSSVPREPAWSHMCSTGSDMPS